MRIRFEGFEVVLPTSYDNLNQTMRTCLFPFLLATGFLVGCPSSPNRTSEAASTSSGPTPSPKTSSHPVADPGDIIIVPANVRKEGKHPFILFLHGLGGSGTEFAATLDVDNLARERRFAYATPNGSMDSTGRRYWNASSACCNADGANVDHVGRLRRLLLAAAAHSSVDPNRLYILGFSNGGFMAHRLACEIPEVAAIASIAGAGPAQGEPCSPPAPVAVMQIHGDKDLAVDYQGGHTLGITSFTLHPSAHKTVEAWAERNGCKSSPLTRTVDFDPALPGDETVVTAYRACRSPVELWTVQGGSHFVGMARPSLERILAFLEKRRKM